jgi:hypothetical protein
LKWRNIPYLCSFCKTDPENISVITEIINNLKERHRERQTRDVIGLKKQMKFSKLEHNKIIFETVESFNWSVLGGSFPLAS